MNIKMIMGLLAIAGLTASCNQSPEKVQAEANKEVSHTNEDVQKVIDELGLVYVEEGAQNIITYEEVNLAQQAWCDALVKIG
jgi:hypothetical protein